MSEEYAFRNMRLCTKDCICLYVCPTGATDTENSIIDVNKCNGCGKCALACPSKAISIVPKKYPPQQLKSEQMVSVLNQLSSSKTNQEAMARSIAESTDMDGLNRLMKAFAMSNRIMAEDIIRESGYMLPQSANAHDFLEYFIANPPAGFPVDTAKKLLSKIPCNER